jgi:hypothetical protein
MTENSPTILTGTAPPPPAMADPRKIRCLGRKRFLAGPGETIETVAHPSALSSLAEAGELALDETIDVVGTDFLLVLRITEIDRESQQVRVDVIEEHIDLPLRGVVGD